MSALSEHLNDCLGDRSGDDVVAAAAKSGHKIDRTAVYAYLRDEGAKHPRESTLQALAAGFGTDVRILRTLAGKPAGELGPYVPTDDAASLTKEQRAALDQLIKTIVRGAPDAGNAEAQKIGKGVISARAREVGRGVHPQQQTEPRPRSSRRQPPAGPPE